MIDEMLIGMAFGSAISMLVTFGMGLQLFHSKVRAVTDSQNRVADVLENIVIRQRDEGAVMKEMVRVLGCLDVKHTMLQADAHGFGTVKLTNSMETLLREQRLHVKLTEEFRKEHARVHDELLRVLQAMG
jgi:hypothetical protein